MTIQISRDTWHFKIVKFFFDGNSRGLCQYARRLVLSMCLATCLFFVGCGAIWFMIGMPIKYVLSFFYDFTYSKDELVFTYIAFAAWGVIATMLSCFKITEIIKSRNEGKPKSNKKPSVFVEYIKAKKQKVCPNIEFV